MWNDKPPSLCNFKVFGCASYAHQKERKLDLRLIKCAFLGYGDVVKGFKLWCIEPKGKRLIISWDVVFNEDIFSYLQKTNLFLNQNTSNEPKKNTIKMVI